MNTVYTHVSQIGMGFFIGDKIKICRKFEFTPDKNQLRKKV